MLLTTAAKTHKVKKHKTKKKYKRGKKTQIKKQKRKRIHLNEASNTNIFRQPKTPQKNYKEKKKKKIGNCK